MRMWIDSTEEKRVLDESVQPKLARSACEGSARHEPKLRAASPRQREGRSKIDRTASPDLRVSRTEIGIGFHYDLGEWRASTRWGT